MDRIMDKKFRQIFGIKRVAATRSAGVSEQHQPPATPRQLMKMSRG